MYASVRTECIEGLEACPETYVMYFRKGDERRGGFLHGPLRFKTNSCKKEGNMKVKRMFLLGSLTLVFLFVAFLLVNPPSAQAAEKVYRMKIQSAYPRGDLSMELLKDFADSAAKRSNGRIKISVFAEPELVPAEQLFSATQKGLLDMLHAVAAMWGGVVPVGEVEFGLPFAYNIPGDKDIVESGMMVRKFFFDTGFVDLLRKEYAKQGLYWLDMHSYGKIFTLASKPIISCDDLQGKKFRVEGSWADYYNALGAHGTYVSGMEAYMALKLGTIDASQWDVSAITGLKWHEVAPYWLIGGQNDVVPGHILMNMKTWDSLSADLKEALKGAAEEYYHKLLDVYVGEMKIVQDLVDKGEVKLSKLNDDCEKMHAEAAYKLWDKIGERDAAAAKAIGLIKEWRKTLK
jgi:TRAP-type C4-dicarboxylate transport system substrate-binding protein